MRRHAQAAHLGDEPRRVLNELADLRTVDVILPTSEGVELRRRCITRPTEHQAILLHQLGLNLRGLPARQQDRSVQGALLLDEQYAYDRSGNVSGITDGLVAGHSRVFGYDALQRLTAAAGAWGQASYSYDAADNLRTADVGSRRVGLAYDGRNRLARLTVNGGEVVVGHDARGNLSARGAVSYGFDLGNRLVHVGQVNGYTYDGHGRRVRVVASDGSTRVQVYGVQGKLLWSTQTGAGRPDSSTAYVHLGDKLVAQWEKTGAGVGTRYIHTDVLGSPVVRTNTQGQEVVRTRYEPYGAVAGGSAPGPTAGVGLVGFTGHVQDPETELVYMQQRYYDPVAGRFLSVDPVTTDAATGSSFNRYVYGNNNPYRFKDPDGRAAVGITFERYQVDTGLGFKLPLGHAGVLTIDDKSGRTSYFEFGRYDPKGASVIGAKLPQNEGNVRKVDVPDAKIGKDGQPTKESVQKIYNYLSKNVGHGAKVSADYRADADAKKTEDFAKGVANNANREGYSVITNNCYDFKNDALKAGEK